MIGVEHASTQLSAASRRLARITSVGDEATAQFIHAYADFLERHVEGWTVTTEGALLPGVSRHYIRIHPVDPYDSEPNENPNAGVLALRNRPPGATFAFPAAIPRSLTENT